MGRFLILGADSERKQELFNFLTEDEHHALIADGDAFTVGYTRKECAHPAHAVIGGPEFIARDDIVSHRVDHVLLVVDSSTPHDTVLASYAPTTIVHYEATSASDAPWSQLTNVSAVFNMTYATKGEFARHMRTQTPLAHDILTSVLRLLKLR